MDYFSIPEKLISLFQMMLTNNWSCVRAANGVLASFQTIRGFGQEELIANARAEYEALQSEMSRIQQENSNAKEEVKEVLQALEELAVNYDAKSQEIDNKNKDIDNINEELQQKQNALATMTTDFQQLKDIQHIKRKE
uniref:Uncharacterized protein n=1 Tax=Megaselia scalaris TaxID=36166 RepID=T1GGN0_MEGSC